MSALRIEGLIAQRGKQTVLRGLSFEAREGEVLAIVGPNGAGKSTLFECLTMSLPWEGDAFADDRALRAMSPRERAGCIAYVPQRSELRAALSVRDVVALGRFAHGKGVFGPSAEDRARVESCLEAMDLQALSARAYPALSLGQQQRVMIARALATGAPILLLDEPTAALDIRQRLLAMERLVALSRRGHTVVVIMHELADVLRFADRVLLLHEGAIVGTGRPSEVLIDENLRHVYGVRRSSEHAFALLDEETS